MVANSALLAAVIFAFLIAFVFSMFGQGGGSVYSPLLLLLGYSILLSTSTSLVLNLITSLSAGYIFYRKEDDRFQDLPHVRARHQPWRLCRGSLSKSFNTTVLLWVFVVFLVGVGARMIYTYWEKEKVEEIQPKSLSIAMYVLHRGIWFGSGIHRRPAGSWRRHFRCSVHGLRLQDPDKDCGRLIAFDHLVFGPGRDPGSRDVSPFRSFP